MDMIMWYSPWKTNGEEHIWSQWKKLTKHEKTMIFKKFIFSIKKNILFGWLNKCKDFM